MAKKPETKKTPKHTPKPRVHQDLHGLEVSIDQFGELRSNMDIEKINEFLNKNVDDKKLAEREDYEVIKKKGKPKKK
ncbi:MAG: hypothetical protein ACOYXA_06155 [Bacteroidota bacterium]